MAFRSFIPVLPLASSVLQFRVAAETLSYNIMGYDVGLDWSKDSSPPLTDGNLIDAQNLRGTRLFGYTGCTSDDKKIIHSTYDNFYKLSHVDGLYQNFAWNEQAAKGMWGATSGRTPIPDERKEEIRRAFRAPFMHAAIQYSC